VGQEAIYSVSALQDGYFKGTVTEIRPLPVTAQGSVSYLAVIRGPNRSIDGKVGFLRAGMTTASLDIIVDRYTDVKGKVPWLVPNAALDYTLDSHYWPKGVTKEQLKTPAEWKEKDVDGPKDDDAPTPRVIWLHDPDPKKVGSEAARPVHLLAGKTGKFFDEKRPKLGLQDYTQVVETLPPNSIPGEPPLRAIISDKKPTHKSSWFRLPNFGNVIKF
jgi:hypothetical protein